jgi:tripartite-type tricarboxylate transporter receptor subunit TctC
MITQLLRTILVACLAISAPAWAQGYPTKPLRMIVAFPAGGGSDIVGRIVAAKLSERLGQQVVVENRAGGGGSIGAEAAARAAADGYTVALAGTSEMAINPFIYKLAYDPVKELVPVGLVGTTPMVIVVTPSLSAKSAADLVALAKSQPGQLNVGSAGNGSLTHLAAELFRSMTGVAWVHVPYKGAPPALNDLAGGRVQVMFSTVPAAIGLIKSNLVRPIGVSTQSRAAALPDVPTVAESGIAGYDPQFWYGVFVPAATPRDVMAKLSDAVAQTVKDPGVMDALAKQGVVPASMTPAQFGDYVKADAARWAKVVADSGAKAD